MAYEIKITLERTHSPVWRKLVIPSEISFKTLHEAIQIAFEWENDHLHDFMIPKTDIHIEPKGNSGFGISLPEETTPVDYFLKNNKSITYTYDFGDDWNHKITLVKEIEDTPNRQIYIKSVKGDPFEEDSGGTYYGQQMPINETAISQAIAGLKCPKCTMSKKVRQTIDQIVCKKELEKSLSDIKKFIDKKAKTSSKNNNLDKMMKEISTSQKQHEAWKQFLEDRRNKKKPNNKKESNNIPGQISLFGVSDEEDNTTYEYKIEKVTTDKSLAEMLSNIRLYDLNNYHKYLQIPDNIRTERKELSQQIADYLKQHPEYIYHFMEKDQIAPIRSLIKEKDGLIESDYDEVVSLCMSLGALETNIVENESGKTAKIMVCKEFIDLFLSKKAGELNKLMASNQVMQGEIISLMLCYGIVDIPTLYHNYSQLKENNISEEDFTRFVYCNMAIKGYLKVGTDLDNNKPFVCMEEFLNDEAFKYYSDKPYASYELYDKKAGINPYNMHPILEELFSWMTIDLNIDERQAEECIHMVQVCVLVGDTIEDIYNLLSGFAEPNSMFDDITLSSIALGLVMELPMMELHGFSRSDILSKFTLDYKEIPSLTNTDRGKMSYDTPMIQFNHDELLELMSAKYSEINLTSPASPWKKLSAQNEQITFLYIDELLEQGYYKEAQTEYNKLCTKHKGSPEVLIELQNIINNYIRVNSSYMKQQPIRVGAKIGANDPCPCGSGKKYKKCCRP